jgi:putative protease
MIKPDELTEAGRLLDQLARHVRPEGLIVQDPGLIELARQLGYRGEIHISTLACVSFGRALPFIRDRFRADRVVLPRELSIDEVKQIASACPEDLELEVFVHGALCYAISGRCYWSSWLGGKSGLRGRCVQPCRRVYSGPGGQKRYFSCLDLGLGVLARTLLDIPGLAAWKIEGRKKGPHYVFYTTRAYRLLRDNPDDAQAKKAAGDILEQALGRQTTTYNFLPQSPHLPVQPDRDTGSGLFLGRVKNSKSGAPTLRTRTEILPGDRLRIGYQDQPGHFVYKASKYTAKGDKLPLPESRKAPGGAPAFLIDRREPELKRRIAALDKELRASPAPGIPASSFRPSLPERQRGRGRAKYMQVWPALPHGRTRGETGLWLKPDTPRRISKTLYSRIWFWLPPVMWPGEAERWAQLVQSLRRSGAVRFVLNAPWQAALFGNPDGLELWAGPFCNLANPLALQTLHDAGFSGAFASPELDAASLLALPGRSPIPLGAVLEGYWPLCLSRTLSQGLKPGDTVASPKNEVSWVKKYGPTYYHFPNWELDLTEKRQQLEEAGYVLLARLHEKRVSKARQPAGAKRFNWDLDLQ